MRPSPDGPPSRPDRPPAATRQAWRQSLPQRAMQWQPLIRIYQSRLWRRNPLFGLVLGIPFAGEQAAMLAALGLKPDATVLDLACGPGILSRPIARHLSHGRCLGLDLSRPMLRRAQRQPRRGAAPVYLCGNALSLPLADRCCDAVICGGALHMFPDIDQALDEITRVLKPGGHFAVSVVLRSRHPLNTAITGFLAAGGIAAWRPHEFQQALQAAGLGHIRIIHARHIWMLAAAVRPPRV